MSDNFIWMPVYWGDYFKNTFHLTTEEHGAYFLLMGYYWQNGKIKNDKKLLKNITKISEKKLQNVLSFFEEKEGYLYHGGLDEEKAKSAENKAKQKKRTEAATSKRWGKNDSVTLSVTDTTSPSPSHTSSLRSEVAALISAREENPFSSISEKIQKVMNSPIPLNTQIVKSWIQAGADDELILETITSIVAKKSGEQITSLKYFQNAVLEAVSLKNQKLTLPEIRGKPRQMHTDFERQDFNKGLEGFDVV